MGITILAINGINGDLAERATALAAATGMSLYEARRHLAPRGPRVLATYGEPTAAAAAATALAAASFDAIVLDSSEPAGARMDVRSFAFDTRTLRAGDRQGRQVQLPVARIEVLVRGVRATGPDEREPFLEIYAPDAPALVLAERQLQYDGLHLERQPTAAANFTRLANRLRGLAPHALYDERLNTRSGQLQVLGDVLTPEAHLVVATRLLAQALQRLRTAA